MRFLQVILAVAVLVSFGDALTPSTFFSKADQERLKSVFTSAISKTPDDIANLHYSVLGLKLLGATAPNTGDLCKKFQAKMETNPMNIYLSAEAGKVLNCKLKASADASQVLKAGQSSDVASDFFYSSLAQLALGNKIDSASTIKSIQSILKKDDSVINLGLAFKLASLIDSSDVKAIFDRIEDAIVQADEVDGKMLQFEGGISVTDMVISGAYDLASKMGKAPQISKMQASKFANYFLSRKSVQAAKGGYHLLNALTTMTTNKYHIPVAVTLGSQSTVVSESSPKVQVQVTNLLGASLGKMDVTIESAMRQSDGAVVLSKSKMTSLDETTYQVDMMAAKPGRGFYELTVNAVPVKADARLAGNSGATLLVKALGAVVISGAEIGVGDADQSSPPKMQAVSHPNKLASLLKADHHHRVIFKFAITDKSSNEKMRAHQTFVRLFNAKTKSEIIFVAEPDSNSVYKFDLDLSTKAKDFGGVSGKYELSLIVGDAIIANPIQWVVADIDLKFQDEVEAREKSSIGPKPEISHLFREPEKRPPTAVSNLFTILCLVPIVLMFIGWALIGVNISGFPFSLSALGFHLGLGGIFALYYCFWLQLDMFATLKYLMMMAVVTFLCGNSMLVRLAEKRKQN